VADDIAFLSATELLARYRAKSLSPVEVIEETLRRLETYEGALNAFVLYDPESARAAARASEARWRKGEPLGLLDGIPVAIKDTQLTRGWPRLVGSRTIDPDQAWSEDAPAAARLRAENAVFFGKTTTSEFGWKPTTDSPLSGVTRNPWNLERTPGGSSGGSAAALAAGICPLAIGTDAGGSIRVPAAFSGVFGLKPTFGRIGLYPPSAFGDVSHVGPMSRTVEDAALMLDAMKGPDPRDWYSLPDDGVAYRERVRDSSMTGKRVALSPTLGYAEPAPAVREAVEAAAKVFGELGASVECADPFSVSPLPVFQTLAGRLLGAHSRDATGEDHTDGPGACCDMPLGRESHPGRARRGARQARRARRADAAILRALRHPAVADNADHRGLCRASQRRPARSDQLPRVADLYLGVQPHTQPVGLDPLRHGGRTADRADGDRPALQRSRRAASLPRL
jgi:Asp-tRNA(Asn)/Glu-tRNA(Gln) amidotransferase A subunit family amidase